jgi:hypothetical protein
MDAYLMLAEREKQRKADKIGVGVGIGIGVEKEIGMAFGHEKLDVYRAASEYQGPARPDRGDVHETRPARVSVCEEQGEYSSEEIDPDTDPDPDPDPERSNDRQPPTTGEGDGIPPPHR